jgi:hypothetical protein
MAEKKPVPKVEPLEKKRFSEKVYKSSDDRYKAYQKRLCTADLDDFQKRLASLPFGATGYLSPRDAVQRMYSNDQEVRKLQRRTVVNIGGLFKDPTDKEGWGAAMREALQEGTDKPLDEVCKKGVPKYIYEPNVRYKRIENPDYKRHKNYSMAGTITGIGMLATGIASGILPLAYAGAALAISSFGYRSGHWLTNRKEDLSFEKLPSSLSELEKKAQGPVQKTVNEPKDEGLNQSLKHWITDYVFKKSSGLEEKVKEPKDDALYVKRLYVVHPPMVGARGAPNVNFHYTSIDSWKNPLFSGWGMLGTGLTAVAAIGAAVPNPIHGILATAGYLGLATLSHYLGSIFGYKDTPEYRKVSGLEEKD